MPPTRKRLFLGAIDVGKQLTAANRRRTVAITSFGHMLLPDNFHRYPDPYITALLKGVRGPITPDALRRFNNSPAARESLRQADVDLHIRLNEWLEETTQPGFLGTGALSWVLGVDRSRIVRWHQNELVTSKQAEDRTFIEVADLLTKCRWVLPK